jgi:hypothetical protein
MSESNNNPLFGKPWENAFVYKTFKGADNKRNTILTEGSFQVKVKRRSDGQFVVKTRVLEVVSLKKKNKKTKKVKQVSNEG